MLVDAIRNAISYYQMFNLIHMIRNSLLNSQIDASFNQSSVYPCYNVTP